MSTTVLVVDMLNDFTLEDAPLKVEENKKEKKMCRLFMFAMRMM